MISTVRSLPNSPGVYQYFDAKGKLLYVGKAKSLKHRVKSYWRFTPKLFPIPARAPVSSKCCMKQNVSTTSLSGAKRMR